MKQGDVRAVFGDANFLKIADVFFQQQASMDALRERHRGEAEKEKALLFPAEHLGMDDKAECDPWMAISN